MRGLELRHVGSRGVFIVPERVTGASKTQEAAKAKPSPAPQIFVAGKRNAIDEFARNIQQWPPDAKNAEEFRRNERVEPLSESRLKPTLNKKGNWKSRW